jgi:putative restriction endonuclease
MTSVGSPLPLNPQGQTVLLGYEPGLKAFAGFDISMHRRFTTGSPSVQIDIRKVREANLRGLAFDHKENGEIAVGIRPDHLLPYVEHSADLHRMGTSPDALRIVSRAAQSESVSNSELQTLSAERQRVVQTISRLSRFAGFRQSVLQAYGSACAVTGMQLGVIDAAHILPVGAPGSIDHVTNGIALAPTIHRAYDQGLIYFDTSYVIQINRRKESQLQRDGLHGGILQLTSFAGKKIKLPSDSKTWPKAEFIRKANALRI